MQPRRNLRIESLASTLLRPASLREFASILSQLDYAQFRIRIGGYPACGKTTLSQELARRLPWSVHIQAESWLLPLEDRKARDLSGAHPEGYDLQRSVNDLDIVLKGLPVFLSTYNHRLGRHDGGTTVTMRLDGSLILDGTPFTLADYARFGDLSLFLVPASLEDWLARAIDRDVRARYFSKSEATRHNMRKARDLELVWRRSPGALRVRCQFSTPYRYDLYP